MRPGLFIALVMLVGCTGTVDGTTFVLYAITDKNVGDANGDTTDQGNDAVPADTLVDADPCTSGDAVFCDDFEAATVGIPPPAPWTIATSKGKVTVATTESYSGSNAVKFTTTASTSDPNVYRAALMRLTTDAAPITDNAFFGRMMVWFGATPPDTALHWSNIKASGTVTTETYAGTSFTASYNYGGQQSRFMANYDTSGGPATDCWQHSTVTPDPQTWYCVEWQFDGPNDTMRFWLDGNAIDALTMIGQGQGCIDHDLNDRWVAPEFDTIALGWEHYQVIDNPVEFYIDDVALGPQRLGCPR